MSLLLLSFSDGHGAVGQVKHVKLDKGSILLLFFNTATLHVYKPYLRSIECQV
jgi:hypothetical protein